MASVAPPCSGGVNCIFMRWAWRGAGIYKAPPRQPQRTPRWSFEVLSGRRTSRASVRRPLRWVGWAGEPPGAGSKGNESWELEGWLSRGRPERRGRRAARVCSAVQGTRRNCTGWPPLGGWSGVKGPWVGVKRAFGNKMATGLRRAKWRRAGGGASDRACAQGAGREGGAGVPRPGGGRRMRGGGCGPRVLRTGEVPGPGAASVLPPCPASCCGTRSAAAAPLPAGPWGPAPCWCVSLCHTGHISLGLRCVGRERAIAGGVLTNLTFQAMWERLC